MVKLKEFKALSKIEVSTVTNYTSKIKKSIENIFDFKGITETFREYLGKYKI